MPGENRAVPGLRGDPLRAPAAAALRARMPSAARRAAYIYTPRAWGGAGHLNERPIEGRRRGRVAGPTCAVGEASGVLAPIPLHHARVGRVWRGKERCGSSRELDREEGPRGKRCEPSFRALTAPLSEWAAPHRGVAPVALVLHWLPQEAST